MMNRRSILSSLCTGALALLAPVVAWGKPRRWVGFHNRGIKPMVITPHGVVDAQHYEALGREHIRARANNILLRALLAEARDLIANTHQEHVPGCVDCKPLRAMGDRIDAALKV